MDMTERPTLNEIGLNYGSDKSSNYHCYLDFYDQHFYSYRDMEINMLEIGILFGESLNIFYDYFRKASIFAIDIEDKSHLQKERVKIIQGNQSDRVLLNSFENDFFDIILDDGSHKMEHQQVSFGALFKKLKSGGIYIIEDLHTSFDNYSQNISHGPNLFGIEPDNRTTNFLNGLISGNGNNKYLTEEEYQYLSENIQSINIKETSRKSDREFSLTSIIIKK